MTDHAHALNSFRLPRWQLGLPRHIVILKHAQTKGYQSVIGFQYRSINKRNGDTLASVRDRLNDGIERHLVRGEELGCFFLNERLETALVDGKLVVWGETSGSDVEGIIITLNQR